MRATLNNDYRARDKRLFPAFGNAGEWLGGIARFTHMGIDDLQWFIDNSFIALDETHNFSPDTEAFVAFLQDNPRFYVHGYAVTHDREDYRMTIEGCGFNRERSGGKPLTRREEREFMQFARYADEAHVAPSKAWCWWD